MCEKWKTAERQFSSEIHASSCCFFENGISSLLSRAVSGASCANNKSHFHSHLFSLASFPARFHAQFLRWIKKCNTRWPPSDHYGSIMVLFRGAARCVKSVVIAGVISEPKNPHWVLERVAREKVQIYAFECKQIAGPWMHDGGITRTTVTKREPI